MARKVAAIGDIHAPFANEKVLRAVFETLKAERPDVVVQVGDAFDWFSASRFPRIQKVNPEDEVDAARSAMEEFWETVRRVTRGATCYQLIGNHDVRPLKRIVETVPELHGLILRSWRDLYKFQGVNTVENSRDDLLLDGVVYEHGGHVGSAPGRHMRENMRPTVLGHSHKPHIHYERIRDEFLWELNVGYLADPTADALSYTEKRWVKWGHGVGFVDPSGYPRFVPLLNGPRRRLSVR